MPLVHVGRLEDAPFPFPKAGFFFFISKGASDNAESSAQETLATPNAESTTDAKAAGEPARSREGTSDVERK